MIYASLVKIQPKTSFSVMAALICIKDTHGTFWQLFNIANRFLRVFVGLVVPIPGVHDNLFFNSTTGMHRGLLHLCRTTARPTSTLPLAAARSQRRSVPLAESCPARLVELEMVSRWVLWHPRRSLATAGQPWQRSHGLVRPDALVRSLFPYMFQHPQWWWRRCRCGQNAAASEADRRPLKLHRRLPLDLAPRHLVVSVPSRPALGGSPSTRWWQRQTLPVAIQRELN